MTYWYVLLTTESTGFLLSATGEGGDTVKNILVIGNVLVISLGMESDSFNQQIESPRRISTGNLNIMIVSYVYIYGLYLQ